VLFCSSLVSTCLAVNAAHPPSTYISQFHLDGLVLETISSRLRIFALRKLSLTALLLFGQKVQVQMKEQQHLGAE
jgi:hypothetical protein